jgi:uncharacterized protein YndB with AHSA1/START domain
MGTVSARLSVPPARVYDVLADGWLFTGWVVGTSHIRAVDPRWPAAGSRIHHAFGAWPLVIRDTTLVEASEPAQHLVLLANGRPFGQARVDIRLAPDGDGTQVTMGETLVSGPGRALPKPVLDRLINARNQESLARLAALAEQPTAPDD